MSQVKRALILGTLAGQVDAIEELQSRGIKTFACGHEPKGPGVEAADEFFIADITDVNAVQRLAEDLNVDLIYSVGSDIAMPTVVKVSETLGTPFFHGSELTFVLRRKEELRRTLSAAHISPVEFEYVKTGQHPDWDIFPCIVKPVDAQGQRGISVVYKKNELPAAVKLAKASSSSDDAIIEELMTGPEVSAHVIVKSGEVHLIIPSDRHVWQGALSGIPEAHSIPLNQQTATAGSAIHELVIETVHALGVTEGPLYFQMILTRKGPRIIEIASRLDGCHLWRMIEKSTGYNILSDVLGRLCGSEWKAPTHLNAEPTTLRFFLDSPEIKVTEKYKLSNQTPGGDFVEWQLEPENRPRKTNSVVSRLGYEVFPGILG